MNSAATGKLQETHCRSCGRRITPRRRWGKTWSQVRFCSRYCRARGVNFTDRNLERAMLELLDCRARGSSICPSEAARSVAAGGSWRPLMEPARRAARRLAHCGRVEILQNGKVVDPSDFSAPVRIRST